MVRILVGALSGLALAAGAASAAEGIACEPGFTVVPGTRTCIRTGGRVSADATAGSRGTGLGARARVSVDARTQTEYGPLRAYVEVGARR